MKKPKNSCYNCRTRIAGCHSTCEKYKTYQEEMKAYSNELRRQKQKEHEGTANWTRTTRKNLCGR